MHFYIQTYEFLYTENHLKFRYMQVSDLNMLETPVKTDVKEDASNKNIFLNGCKPFLILSTIQHGWLYLPGRTYMSLAGKFRGRTAQYSI